MALVVQVVFIKLGPDPGPGVQLATKVGPVLLSRQVRSNQLLPDAAVCGAHDATGVSVVWVRPQTVVKPPELVVLPTVQDATKTSTVRGLVQVVSV